MLCGNERRVHFGRVLAVGRDRRTSRRVDVAHDTVVVQVQRIVGATTFDVPLRISDALPAELFLVEGEDSYMLEHEIEFCTDRIAVHYGYNSAIRPSDLPSDIFRYVIRRIINSNGRLRPVSQAHPLRGELELQVFTRQGLINAFDTQQTQIRVISLPLMIFIDGFGLYRNMYRSLMGIYLINAAFSFQERNRRVNVFPLTLGPHGSNLSDVIKAIGPLMSQLDRGLEVMINGEPTFICAFTMAYLGDMPQQNENSGILNQKANRGCRFCTVPAVERGKIDYDIVGNGRFHHEMVRIRQHMNSATENVKKRLAKDNSLTLNPPALQLMTPALDLVISRPSDPAHSEYGGISRLMHTLLLDSILILSLIHI